MAYIDRDGETILQTPGEIVEFANATSCQECAGEAMELLEHMGNATPVKIVFSTTCVHGGNQ